VPSNSRAQLSAPSFKIWRSRSASCINHHPHMTEPSGFRPAVRTRARTFSEAASEAARRFFSAIARTGMGLGIEFHPPRDHHGNSRTSIVSLHAMEGLTASESIACHQGE
jgi:hypothetical protein